MTVQLCRLSLYYRKLTLLTRVGWLFLIMMQDKCLVMARHGIRKCTSVPILRMQQQNLIIMSKHVFWVIFYFNSLVNPLLQTIFNSFCLFNTLPLPNSSVCSDWPVVEVLEAPLQQSFAQVYGVFALSFVYAQNNRDIFTLSGPKMSIRTPW